MVSLTPSNTEIVAFLGHLEDLVGVDDWSDWPPSVQHLKQVGPDLQIDIDAVQALDPDLVLASLSVPGQETVVDGLDQANLPHITLAPKTLGEVIADIRRIGQALDAEARAEALIAAMEAELDRLGSLTADLKVRDVYWEWWPKPPIAAGGPGWMTEVIAHAGGTNILADREEESPKVTLEQIAQHDPDAVALCWQGSLQAVQSAERFKRREGWDTLAAAQASRILEMPEELYGRPGPRLLEGIRHLAVQLHPELEGTLDRPYAWVADEIREDLGDALTSPDPT